MNRAKPMRDAPTEAQKQLAAGMQAVQAEFMSKVQAAYSEAIKKNRELLRSHQRSVFEETFATDFDEVVATGDTSDRAEDTSEDHGSAGLSEELTSDPQSGSVAEAPSRKQTAKEIALDVLRDAGKPIGWDQVTASIKAQGLLVSSAKKVRTILQRAGLIEFSGGLCALTPEGQRSAQSLVKMDSG